MTAPPVRSVSARSMTVRPRPLVITLGSGDPCATCGTRAESVCNALEDKDLERLASVAVLTEIEPGTTFIGEGDPATDFFNVTSGHVKLFKLLPDGRRQITGFAQAGVFLGLAGSSAYSFSAEAIDEVRLCRFPRRKLQTLMSDFPALEKRLLETASNELIAAQEQMLLLGRKTARERLATFLYARCSHAVACDKRAAQNVTLPMNRNDIADYLGLTIETVSRTFTRLKTEKLIAVPNATTVVVLDVEALAHLADGFASDD